MVKMSSNISEDIGLTQENDKWVLVLERILEHPRNEVWAALTSADQIPSWGPFTTDRDLITVGGVPLQHIDMPEAEVMQGYVLEVDAQKLLVFQWGDDILRWELRDEENKTYLTLRHRFAERSQAPSYAAGWHLCLDGLAGTLNGEKIPSMAGHNAMKYGWQELYEKYAKQLGINQKAGI
jgi:uncharacterized protein YndB with AHSA1/START domain